jgi:hypothetical protein
MRNTADVTGGKPFAVGSQSIADVSAVNPYTFNDIHRRKGEVLFLLGVFVSFYYVFVFFVIYFFSQCAIADIKQFSQRLDA